MPPTLSLHPSPPLTGRRAERLAMQPWLPAWLLFYLDLAGRLDRDFAARRPGHAPGCQETFTHTGQAIATLNASGLPLPRFSIAETIGFFTGQGITCDCQVLTAYADSARPQLAVLHQLQQMNSAPGSTVQIAGTPVLCLGPNQYSVRGQQHTLAGAYLTLAQAQNTSPAPPSLEGTP